MNIYLSNAVRLMRQRPMKSSATASYLVQLFTHGVFHALLFHRTHGKVRAASEEMDRLVKKEVRAFRDELRSGDGSVGGHISLEFHQKKRAHWPFPAECIPWEVWIVKVNVVTLPNEHERQVFREKVGESLTEHMLYIVEALSRHEYVPKIPNQTELDLVFDVSLPDVQPYLFKISYQTDMTSSTSVGTTVRRFFKDTLAL